MQDLKEIALLLQQHGINPFRDAAGASKQSGFWDALHKQRNPSDDSIAAVLYGGGPEDLRYRKLKSDFRDRLQQSVLEIDNNQPAYSDYQKAYYDCHRQWAVVRILTGHNANTAALSMAGRLLKKAEKFDFTLLAMDVASFLRTQYGLRESNERKFEEAHASFEHFKAIYEAESRAEELYTRLVSKIVNRRAGKEEVRQMTSAFNEIMAPLMEKHASYRLQLYGYLLQLMHHTSHNDFEQALACCEKGLAFFESRPYEPRVPLQILYYHKLLCYIQTRAFDEGEQAAKYCLNSMQEGTFNWFKYRELYLQLSLYTRQYDKALSIFVETIQHSRFGFMPGAVKEIWEIYGAYLHFITLLGWSADKDADLSFKLSRFVNNTPILSKDKSGGNVPIMIIKILLMLKEQKLAQLLDNVEAIDQYCYRHLRIEGSKRSFYFLKMLLGIPLSGFDAETCVVKTQRYANQLKEIPLNVASPVNELEVIPYEDLWEMTLNMLASMRKVSAAA